MWKVIPWSPINQAQLFNDWAFYLIISDVHLKFQHFFKKCQFKLCVRINSQKDHHIILHFLVFAQEKKKRESNYMHVAFSTILVSIVQFTTQARHAWNSQLDFEIQQHLTHNSEFSVKNDNPSDIRNDIILNFVKDRV